MNNSIKLFLKATLTISIIVGCSDMGEPEILLPELMLGENTIDFATITTGTSQHRSFNVVNLGAGVLTGELTLVQDSTAFSLSPAGDFDLVSGDTLIVELSFSPGSVSNFGGSIIITSNDPGNSERNIALSGSGTATLVPVLAFSHSELNYGTLLTSSSLTQEILLSSTGTDDLIISAIDIDLQAYEVDVSLPLTLVPGTSFSLAVTFIPETAGTFDSEMTIHSNSIATPQKITLTGIAEAALSYAADIQPIWNTSCTGCHGSSGGLNLTSYSQMMSGGNSGAVVISGDGENSRIVKKMRGTAGTQMPMNRTPLPASTIDMIGSWIEQGAINN